MKVIRHVSMVLFAVLFAVLFSTVALAGDVRTDYNHKVNFEQFHTYSWGQVQTSDPLWVPRIKHAVNQALTEKGWQEVPSGGEITVMAVGSVHDQRQYQTFYDGLGPGGWGWGGPGWGGWGGWGGDTGISTTNVENTPVGTLVVDLYQNSDKQLVWRGTSSETLSDKTKDNIKNLDKNVDKMFKKFPPKEKAEKG
jgi:hypothetical protein